MPSTLTHNSVLYAVVKYDRICFYRAMLHCMYSADYAIARCMFVCLSIYPSHTTILSKRLNISSNFFHPPVATPFQCFHTKRYGIPMSPPAPSVGVDCTGYEKIAIFRRISRVISEMILDRAIVTIKYKIIGIYTRPTQGCHFE